MFVVVVYDVNEKRVNDVMRFLRGYLKHVQRSVFEGNVSNEVLKEIKEGLERIINDEEDSVYIFVFDRKEDVKVFHMGTRLYEDFEVI